MSDIRLRLAPSPTGYLHIGNLRTALFGYLIAKNKGGKFILRIEDTDQKREVEGAVESLINIINWAGLEFDEGPHKGGPHAPYVQSRRLDIYKKYADELLAKGRAYRCFCTPERLSEMREKQAAAKEPPRYDRACRGLTEQEIEAKLAAGAPYVIRQKMPTEGTIEAYDELRGKITWKADDLDDHVLIKSNGIPTYQFANVVDDHLMEISHVTRGDEWLGSFPKNILLYQAFGWQPPKFIHLPLILNKGGGKLSKRQGDVFVEDYKLQGYLPEALLNFCALLGWHPRHDKETLTMAELAGEFSIKGIGVSPAVFDTEKLDYLNGWHIRQKPLDELFDIARPFLEGNMLKASDERSSDEFAKQALALEQERLKKFSELAEKTEYLFIDDFEYEPELLIWKKLTKTEVLNNLKDIKSRLEALPETELATAEEKIIADLRAEDKKLGDYLWPLRVALSGRKASPGPFDIARVLGKERTLQRLDKAIDKLS